MRRPLPLLALSLLVGLAPLLGGCPLLSEPITQTTTLARFDTTAGEFVLELSTLTPDASGFVEQLAADGFFNDTVFHRASDAFLVETGRFTRALVATDTQFPTANEAATARANTRGTVALLPLDTNPNEVGAEFAINLDDNPEFDAANIAAGRPVVGEVLEGLTVIEEISQLQTITVGDRTSVPIEDVVITNTALLPRTDDEFALPDLEFTTTRGRFVVRPDEQSAPLGANEFAALVEEGFYVGLIFHRAVPGEMVIGGRLSSELQLKELPISLPRETALLPNTQGATALIPTTNADGTGFFVNLVDNSALDSTDAAPVFGRVVEGFDVLRSIGELPTRSLSGRDNVPFQLVTIRGVTLEDGPQELSPTAEAYLAGVRFNVENLGRDLLVTTLGELIEILLS